MNNISVLDCTLRDGGRVINCAFEDNTASGIGKQLALSGIDIIEIGFLRDIKEYCGNSTFFSVTADADLLIDKIGQINAIYTVFIDHGLYDISKLPDAKDTLLTGIRYGFTKNDFINNRNIIKEEMKQIKSLGYRLYLQDVNTIGYTSRELLEVIGMVNEIQPVSFGIVDTYGAMYLDDLEYIWNLVDHDLDEEIAIDFHSHDNMEMSFALSQKIIELTNGKRDLILDATLFGMGKSAGNLKTELLVDYLSRKRFLNYQLDPILDAIDRYIYRFNEEHSWGYSVPAFLSGIYKAHPNNMLFLTEKYRLNNKDIRFILSEIDEGKRQRYDYEEIKRIYNSYMSNHIDDSASLKKLRDNLRNKSVLVLAPGRSIDTEWNKITNYIKNEQSIVICVNFIPKRLDYDYVFFANTIHWEKNIDYLEKSRCILTSNIKADTGEAIMIDYAGLVTDSSSLGNNSTLMLLNLLLRVEVGRIAIAGFDGYSESDEPAYTRDFEPSIYKNKKIDHVNKELETLLRNYLKRISGNIEFKFITPSKYYKKGEI